MAAVPLWPGRREYFPLRTCQPVNNENGGQETDDACQHSSGAGWNQRCRRLWDAKGVIHTSPGQRPWVYRPKTIVSTESATHGAQGLSPGDVRLSCLDPMNLCGRPLAGNGINPRGDPGRCPWAGINQALGLRAGVLSSPFLIGHLPIHRARRHDLRPGGRCGFSTVRCGRTAGLPAGRRCWFCGPAGRFRRRL
jgi:hypothetical protein